MGATFQDLYKNTIAGKLKASRSYANPMQVPKIVKIVVNVGVNSTVDKDAFKTMTDELATITGQRPAITRARKSISNFKLREGMVIGARVTLRGRRMYEFLDKLVNSVFPRIRDFRGISPKGFDGRGNYNVGLNDQTIFPEINPDRVKRHQGMNITIVTTAQTDDEARELLREFGMPFAKTGAAA